MDRSGAADIELDATFGLLERARCGGFEIIGGLLAGGWPKGDLCELAAFEREWCRELPAGRSQLAERISS
jgi:hypothetical protein